MVDFDGAQDGDAVYMDDSNDSLAAHTEKFSIFMLYRQTGNWCRTDVQGYSGESPLRTTITGALAPGGGIPTTSPPSRATSGHPAVQTRIASNDTNWHLDPGHP